MKSLQQFKCLYKKKIWKLIEFTTYTRLILMFCHSLVTWGIIRQLLWRHGGNEPHWIVWFLSCLKVSACFLLDLPQWPGAQPRNPRIWANLTLLDSLQVLLAGFGSVAWNRASKSTNVGLPDLIWSSIFCALTSCTRNNFGYFCFVFS